MNLLSVIDHLVYATPNLEDGIKELYRLLGVAAAVGGQHPKWCTQNALLCLGKRIYLEIMGPNDISPDPAKPRPFGIDELPSPKLVTWVVRSTDLKETVSIAKAQGLDLGDIQPGSRKKPDGSTLRWEMTDLTKDREGGVVPYFINWGDSTHPATNAPKGCVLERLKIFHPEADRTTHALVKLGIDLKIAEGPVAFEATISTPKGLIVLR